MAEDSRNQDDPEQKFQEELAWCINHLETSFGTKKLSEKQARDIEKAIKSLKNPKNPLPKKRQLMRVWCKDYRSKMAKEDREFKLDTSVKAKSSKTKTKSIFLKRQKQSAPEPPVPMLSDSIKELKASSSSGFKFNFAVETDEKMEDQEDPKESLVAVEQYKFVKSDNSFAFNFSIPP